MNVTEGARRMQRAGKWMTIIPLSFLLLLASWFAVQELFHLNVVEGHVFGLLDFVVLSIPGMAILHAGWIVEGFAKQDHESGQQLTR